MEIRRLSAGDAPAFRMVRLEALAAHPADFGSDFETEQTRALSHFEAQIRDNHIMGAFLGDGLAGIMALEFRSQAKTRHRAFLWGVYVRPGGRGGVVAPALLDATLAVAFARAEQVELGVRIGNAAAEGLYASRGFTRYGVEPRSHLVDGIYYDDALMVNYRA